MNKILTTLLLAGLILACKPKSEDIKPAAEIVCKKLSYTYLNAYSNQVLADEKYLYNQTGQLIEFKTPNTTTKYEYDPKGNLLKAIGYSKYQGSEIKYSETEYSYNAANQITRQLANVFDPQQNAFKKDTDILYEYYANGKMKKKTWYYLDFNKPFYFADYNENGYETLSHFDGKPYRKTEYNANDLTVKVTQYNLDNNNTVVELYEYNSQNILIKTSIFVNNVLDVYSTAEYDSKGRQLSGIQYNGDGTIFLKSVIEYTGENYKISSYDGQNRLTGYSTVEVQNGLEMKWTYFENDKVKYSIVYTYDAHKNKIKEESYSNSVLSRREEWAYQCD